MDKKVVVIGAGGHGRVISEIVRASGDTFVGFLDDDPTAERLGGLGDYSRYPDCRFVIGIGDANARERIAESFPVMWYTAVHPAAVVSPSAVIGEGSVIMANAVVNAGARVGSHCIVNTGAVVEHDSALEDYVHISVGAKLGGTVTVGRKTLIGIGATVVNNLTVCENCLVGAGAVVVKDLRTPGIYKGVPARLKQNESTDSGK